MGEPLRGLFFALFVALAVASSTFGQAVVPAESEKVSLEIGDQYEIVVERHGVVQKFSGTLVDVDNRWLVLYSTLEIKPMQRAPKVLLATQMFNEVCDRLSTLIAVRLLGHSDNVGIGRTAEFHWLPREAATVARRTVVADKVEIEPPEGLPDQLCGFSVQFVRDGNAVQWFGKHAFSEAGITCRREVFSIQHSQVPVLGRLPYIGGLFHSTEEQVRSECADCPWEDVVCITDGA